MPSVELISITAVKCFALEHPTSVELTEEGVPENRRFALVDGDGNRLRSSLTSWPIVLRADYDPLRERLRIRFPDGSAVEEDALGDGEIVELALRRAFRARPRRRRRVGGAAGGHGRTSGAYRPARSPRKRSERAPSR